MSDERSRGAFAELKRRLAEVDDLQRAAALLEWDQQTKMPPAGAAARAEQLATVSRIAHELFTADETGRLLDALRPEEERLPHDSDEASLIRVARRDYEKARRVPSEFAAGLARAAAEALPIWVDARSESDFARFRPALERNVELRRRYVAFFDPAERPYDVLLDDFEPGMTTAEVETVFARLKEALIPLAARVAAHADAVDDRCLDGRFPVDQQEAFALEVIERFGFDREAWRLDTTVHPFETALATTDIRLTTRYDEARFGPALFGAMHECGHGLYERGVSPALARSPLASGASAALHESQSRLWENVVGRGRSFWRSFYPRLQRAFPEQFGAVEEETFYRAVNKMVPSPIRVEADEATYSLHIVLRFELEQDLLDGRLAVADLPEAWNARMRDYLGLAVTDDANGVLQDVHWSSGLFGYFPTYALGNVISIQIWERALAEMPDLPDQFERGEFGALRDWLGERLYRHGRKFTTRETLARVVGGPLDPEPYLRYLTAKVDDLYGPA